MRTLHKLLVLSLFLFTTGASAATFTWDGGGADPFWSTGANWVGDVAPGAGDDLVFPAGAARLTNNNDLGVTFNSITIQAANYLLQGAAIHVSNGINATYASGSSRIHSQINTATSQTFSVTNAGAQLNITTGINNAGVLTLDGNGQFLISGIISGTGTVVKNGSGSVVFTNLNAFDGFTVNGGVAGGNGLVGDTIVNAGGTITGGTPVNPSFSTGDLSVLGGTVQLAMVSPLAAQQIAVSGLLTLTGATLDFLIPAGNEPPANAQILLIANDGVDPVVGAFNGLPENAVVTVDGRNFRITYVGGDGNDVALISTQADINVTKTADDTTPAVGQNVTYTIVVANPGATDATDVTLTDTLGAGLTYVSANATQGSCSGTNPVTCNLGTILAGGSATVTVVATASQAGTLTNTATATLTESDPNTLNNTDTETVTAGAAAPVAAVPALDARSLAALALLLAVVAAFALRS